MLKPNFEALEINLLTASSHGGTLSCQLSCTSPAQPTLWKRWQECRSVMLAMTSATYNLLQAHGIGVGVRPRRLGTQTSWSLPGRIVFRFGIVFAALVIFPFPFDVLPGTHSFATEYARIWGAILPWIGGRVGDADPVKLQLIASAVLAVLATISWSIVDREDRAHTWLAAFAGVVLRFWLASAMLAYGVGKLTGTGYEIAEGVAAVTAAALLFWKPTAAIGAVVAGAILTNVAAEVIGDRGSIDVQTAELLLAALLLFLGGAPRLFARARREPSALPKFWRYARIVVKALVIGWLVFHHVHEQIDILI